MQLRGESRARAAMRLARNALVGMSPLSKAVASPGPRVAFIPAILLCLLIMHGEVRGQSLAAAKPSVENLMVVLREAAGANKQSESLEPSDKIRAKLPNGRMVEFEMATYEYLGDLRIELVFAGGPVTRTAQPGDLTNLKLSPAEAINRAVQNIRQAYGAPTARRTSSGLMEVTSRTKATEYTSSYFLDRTYWRSLARRHAKGIVVGVPSRGRLIFAPARDRRKVSRLKNYVAETYRMSGAMRISQALFLFKNDRWTVAAPPVTR